jgi:hypothetical protein
MLYAFFDPIPGTTRDYPAVVALFDTVWMQKEI